jgi:hypothetical protein
MHSALVCIWFAGILTALLAFPGRVSSRRAMVGSVVCFFMYWILMWIFWENKQLDFLWLPAIANFAGLVTLVIAVWPREWVLDYFRDENRRILSEVNTALGEARKEAQDADKPESEQP